MYIYNKTHGAPSEAARAADSGAMGSEQASTSHQIDSRLPSTLSPSPSLPSHAPHPPPSLASQPATQPAGDSQLPQLASPKASAPSVSSSNPAPGRQPGPTRRASILSSFPPIFFHTSNASSTSLAASTAEGKPIPLDNSSAEHRTSALRELSINFPSPVSRHRYAKSSSAQSSTYSQPVLVRTYSGPPPSQHSLPSHKYRPAHSASSAVSRVAPLTVPISTGTDFSSPGAIGRPSWIQRVSSVKDGLAMTPAGSKSKRKMPWQWQSGASVQQQNATKLPPKEAFLCRSILASMEEKDNSTGAGIPGGSSTGTGHGHGHGHGIATDLDRLAEICARSRYSLSNQYEVHVAPHGSGASFLSSATIVPGVTSRRRGGNKRRHRHDGELTLQAVQSDDDSSARGSDRRWRGTGRGASMAHGTLETIMASSRSSEEDKKSGSRRKKKSAAEIAEEVRGRAVREQSDHSATTRTGSGSGGPGSGPDGAPSTNPADPSDHGYGGDLSDGARRLARKKAASFASAVLDLDSSRHSGGGGGAETSPRGSSAALVSEPALPQASTSHLEIHTTPDLIFVDANRDHDDSEPSTSPHSSDRSGDASPDRTMMPPPPRPAYGADKSSSAVAAGGVLSGFGGWIPWRPGLAGSPAEPRADGRPSQAIGSLRQLLITVEQHEGKGKAIDYNA